MRGHNPVACVRGKHSPPCYSSSIVHCYRNLLTLVFLALLVPGCKKQEEIVSFSAPKAPANTPGTRAAMANVMAAPEIPGMAYSAPAGWMALQPHQFEVARFDPGANDKKTFFTISLFGPQFDLAPNIARWRGQVGAESTGAPDSGVATTVGDADAKAFDIQGEKGHMQIVVATRPDKTIVFKLSGPDDKVEAAKPGYDAFLQSVRFNTAGPSQASASEVKPMAPAANVPFSFTAPAEWQTDPRPNPMRVVAWTAGAGSSKAEIFASGPMNPGTFDVASNLDRWRGQVGLSAPASPTDAQTADVQIGGEAGKMIDLTGPGPTPKRLIVAYVGKQDLWFFKIQGPADAVGQQKPAFEKFLASIKFKTGV